MATINVVLDTRRARKDGTFAIVFRIRHKKEFKDIATGYTVRKEQFDFRTNTIIKDNVSNHQLEELRNHYYARLRAYMVANVGDENIVDLRNYLVNKLPQEVTVYELWENEVIKLKECGRIGNSRVHQTSLSVVSQEINLKIPFNKIGYKDLLELESKLLKRGLSINGIGVYMRSFRTICNKAINLDYVDLNWYPFRKYKIKKDKTTPRVLSLKEIQDYFCLDIDAKSPYYKSWLIGKLIFMLRGINLKDLMLLKPANVKGDRIIYKRAKTGKMYSIKIHDEIHYTMQFFDTNETLLGILSNDELNNKLRPLELQTQKRKVINAHLKKLGEMIKTNEDITTYVFRYTYANIAKQLDYSKDIIAEALGHEYGNSVTGIYLEMFDNEKLDEMNNVIINKITVNTYREKRFVG